MSFLPDPRSVRVQTHGRLHMGFLDLNGDLGRQFGSFGVGLSEITTSVKVTHLGSVTGRSQIEAVGEEIDRVSRYADQLCRHYGISAHLKVDTSECITPHAGLGSGTQLALAVGFGIARHFNLQPRARDIAMLLDRGRRSSIGINTFENGGFHMDCGSHNDGKPPLSFFSVPYPQQWRFLLLLDNHFAGLSGEEESQAFKEIEPIDSDTASRLCRLAIMKLIPGMLEQDIATAGSAITEIQAHVGDYFAPFQGGRFTSPSVTEILDLCGRTGAAGYGQSSWGPTGFVMCESEQVALDLKEAIQYQLPDNQCQVKMVCAANRGADISADVER